MLRFFRKKFHKHKYKKIEAPRPPQRISSLHEALVSLQNRCDNFVQPDYKSGFMTFLNSEVSTPLVPKRSSSLQYEKNTPDYKSGFINFLNN